MTAYRKDFTRWAKVAEDIEQRKRPSRVKLGAIYWCNLGVGIGRELVGKNTDFTRPCLVIARFSDDLILVIPITSRLHQGSNYEEIIVNARREQLVLPQARPISVLRVGDFIDDLGEPIFNEIRKRYLRFIKYHLYKKVNPN